MYKILAFTARLIAACVVLFTTGFLCFLFLPKMPTSSLEVIEFISGVILTALMALCGVIMTMLILAGKQHAA